MNTEKEIYEAFEGYKECKSLLTIIERKGLLTFYRKRLTEVRREEKTRKLELKLEKQIEEKEILIQELLQARRKNGQPLTFTVEEITASVNASFDARYN